VTVDELVAKRTRGLKDPRKAPQIEKATRKQYPDGFEAYGADALRFTLASQAGQGRNIRLSVERIAGYRNFGTKLWSAASFGQMNDCKPASDFDPSTAKLPLNQWIVSETVRAAKEVSRCIDSYRFNDAANANYKFAWDTFCSWYLEMAKPLLSGDNAADKLETQQTFAWVFDQILKLLHPFMPFLTEDLWEKIAESRAANLIVSDWPDLNDALINADASADIEWLMGLITKIRSERSELKIPPSKIGEMYLLNSSSNTEVNITNYYEVLKIMGRVSANVGAGMGGVDKTGMMQIPYGDTIFAIVGLVDTEAEFKRLNKEIIATQNEIAKIDKKLTNPAFTEKAPEDVVQLQKDRRATYAEELKKLTSALAVLG